MTKREIKDALCDAMNRLMDVRGPIVAKHLNAFSEDVDQLIGKIAADIDADDTAARDQAEEVGHLERRLTAATGRIAELEAQVVRVCMERSELVEALRLCRKERNAARAELGEEEGVNVHLEHELGDAVRKLESARAEVERPAAFTDKLKATLARVRSQRDELLQQRARLLGRLEAVSTALNGRRPT